MFICIALYENIKVVGCEGGSAGDVCCNTEAGWLGGDCGVLEIGWFGGDCTSETGWLNGDCVGTAIGEDEANIGVVDDVGGIVAWEPATGADDTAAGVVGELDIFDRGEVGTGIVALLLSGIAFDAERHVVGDDTDEGIGETGDGVSGCKAGDEMLFWMKRSGLCGAFGAKGGPSLSA